MKNAVLVAWKRSVSVKAYGQDSAGIHVLLAVMPRPRSPLTISPEDELALTAPFVSLASDCSSWNESPMDFHKASRKAQNYVIYFVHVFEREICSRVKRNNARGGTRLDLQTENIVQYLNPALQGVINYVPLHCFLITYHVQSILRKLKLNIQKRGASSTHAQFLG